MANTPLTFTSHILRNLRGVAGGDGKLGCLCGKAGTSCVCDGSAHSSDGVVNAFNPRRACAARVTVLALCVCLSVCYRSSSYSVRFSLHNQRHAILLGFSWSFEKAFRSKVVARKSQYANLL